ncbi:conserved exported hypothetical protein [uncultured Paludibacter sp.]|nr:conserved exported hypothetical protein [uncultured Paludibacter sp.]
MKINHRLLFLFITHFFSVFCFASMANKITHYTAIQGLSGIDVTAICANENYTWIATNDGLCRFDGKVFKVYKKGNGTKNTISENNIETLFFDSEGLLWIGFKTGGLDVYDPKKGMFTHISKLVDKYPQRVTSIFEDSKKHIWLGSWEEGLFELVPLDNIKTKFKTQVHLGGFIVSGIIEQPRNYIWAGTYAGLYYYNCDKKEWYSVDTKPVVSQLLKTNDSTSFLCSTWNEGVLKVLFDAKNKQNPTIIPLCGKEDEVYRLYSESNNDIFIGTWGKGLKRFNVTEHTLESFDKQFKPLVILSLMKDSYNNLWVGTYGNGLFQICTADQGISSFSPINLSGYAAVYALKSLDNNQIIVGSEGEGLYHYDISHSTLVKKDNGLYKGGQYNFILTIYKDKNLIIIGHDDEGIYISPLNERKPEEINYKLFQADKAFAKVTSIFKSKDDTFWFGTKQNGLISAKYNPLLKIFEKFKFYYLYNIGQITGITQYDNHRIWVASHSGLYLFNIEENKFENSQKPLFSEMIYSIASDIKNHCLWLGTSTGLRKFNVNNNFEVPFLGLLPQEAITNLIIDAYHNLWFSVGSRVFCLQDKNKNLKEINLGGYGNQLFLSSTISQVNGKNCIVFGGEKSLVTIDPQIALNQPDNAKIVFTELQIDHSKVNVGEKIYGKVVLKYQAEYVKDIEFSYRCKWVSLAFTQVGWNNYINHYQYKIDGFSQNWQFFDIDKPIIFSQLQPGEYTLIIKRIDANETPNLVWKLNIVVIPPWYKTGWFYFVLFVTAVLLFVFILYLIINHFKRLEKARTIEMEKKKKEEILLEKESFFLGLSHDLLTPFSLIVAPAGDLMKSNELSTENKEKVSIINKNAIYLSDVFKTILDFRRIEAIDITLEEREIEIISFIKVIVESFRYLAKSKEIDFRFNTDIDPLTIKIDIVKFERILFNLLSNAFKFTSEKGKIMLHLSYVESVLNITLKDDGIGIEPDKLNMIFEKFYQYNQSSITRGFGLGLYIVKKFVTILQGTIEINSQPNNGTTVYLKIPVQRINFNTHNMEQPTLKNNAVEIDDGVSILLVEDNDEMRNYLKKRLSEHFNVATVANGLEALDFIQTNFPEIVISDIMMPEMDGLTLCNKIKSNSLYSDIFVVLVSAKSSPEDELIGYKTGADFYISKPFDMERFVKQILNIYATRIHRRKQILTSFFNQKGKELSTVPKDDFLNKAMQIIEKNITDEEFKIEEFASQMNVSKTVLFRRFKMLIGDSPNTFIKHVRLNKASELLVNSDLTVAEIAYLTGFHQSQYFIKCFKEVYGETPKNYRDIKKDEIN